jgi:Xaa-Pro aminopeptidase
LVSASCNLAIQEAIGGPDYIELIKSPVQKAKAIKNSTELEGFRQCHLRDAAALVNMIDLFATFFLSFVCVHVVVV